VAAGPVDIVFGPDGALYYVAIKAGEIRRVNAGAGGCQTGATPAAGEQHAPPTAVGKPDRTRAELRLRYRKRQRGGAVRISVQSSEAVTASISGELSLGSKSRTYRYRTLRRELQSGTRVVLRLRPGRRMSYALRHAGARKRPVARVMVVATDAAGNVTRATARVSVARA
jgi:hypothetical protein